MSKFSAVLFAAAALIASSSSPAWCADSDDRSWRDQRGEQASPAEILEDLAVLEEKSDKKDAKVEAAELKVARLFLKANNPTLTAEARAAARAELYTARRALAKLQISAAQAREALINKELQTSGLTPERKRVLEAQRLETKADVVYQEARIETINVREKLADPNLPPEARKRLNQKLAENLNVQFEARKRQMAADIAAIDAELADPATMAKRHLELKKQKAGDQLIFASNEKRQQVLEIQARLQSPGLSEADKKAVRAELKQAKREAVQAMIDSIKYRLKNEGLTTALRKMLHAQLEHLRERKQDLGPGKKKKAGEQADGPVVNAVVPEVGGGGPVGQ